MNNKSTITINCIRVNVHNHSSNDDIQPSTVISVRIIMWTLKLLDKECMLYSECIAGKHVARLISWLGTAGSVDCFNRILTVILKYIDLFQFLLVGYSQFLVGPTLGYTSEMRHSINLQV